ncbi:MAG: VOC family protein [Desulfobacterales bacterium]
MALGKIDHISIFVDDLEKAGAYLTEKLGFTLLRNTEHAGKSIELSSPAGDFFLDLHQGNEEMYEALRDRAIGPCHVGHIAFKVDDVDEEYEALKGKGVPFFQDAPVLNETSGRTIVDAADAEGRHWIQLTD